MRGVPGNGRAWYYISHSTSPIVLPETMENHWSNSRITVLQEMRGKRDQNQGSPLSGIGVHAGKDGREMRQSILQGNIGALTMYMGV